MAETTIKCILKNTVNMYNLCNKMLKSCSILIYVKFPEFSGEPKTMKWRNSLNNFLRYLNKCRKLHTITLSNTNNYYNSKYLIDGIEIDEQFIYKFCNICKEIKLTKLCLENIVNYKNNAYNIEHLFSLIYISNVTEYSIVYNYDDVSLSHSKYGMIYNRLFRSELLSNVNWITNEYLHWVNNRFQEEVPSDNIEKIIFIDPFGTQYIFNLYNNTKLRKNYIAKK